MKPRLTKKERKKKWSEYSLHSDEIRRVDNLALENAGVQEQRKQQHCQRE